MSIGKIIAAAGAAAAGVALNRVVEKTVDNVFDKSGSSLKNVLSAIHKQWQAGAGESYVTATQSIRVEPYTLIDARVARLPYIKDVANTGQRLFSSYYLMSIAAENTVNGVKVAKYLDKFATDRDLTAASQSFLSTESYQFGLPFVGEAAGLDRYSDYCVEAANPGQKQPQTPGEVEADPYGRLGTKVDNLKQSITDIAHLSIGQIVNVDITDGTNKATIPVQIRLRTIGVDPVVMSEVLSLGAEDQSRSARLRRWRMGELSLFRDLLMNQDQIDRYRRASMADKSGYFRKVHARANRGLIATALTGTPSIGMASSIAIVSKDTIREVEDRVGARFDDFYTRQRIFEDSLMMLVLVIDEDHETLTVYTRDIDDHAVYTLKDLKGPGQDKGDLSDIMRSFLEGKIPGRL